MPTLNPAAFNVHLNHLGEDFQWRAASACPCINPNSGAAAPACPQCGGKGYAWAPAVKARAAVASSNTQLAWARMGMYETGDMVLSIPSDSPMYGISQFDRVLAPTSSDRFSLALIRGAPAERLSQAVKSIDRVYWLVNDEVVEGSARPTINANGTLTWPGSGSPPAGKGYSITGVRLNEYFCFGAFASDRNKHQGLQLPKRMVLRKFDLLGRSKS